MCPHECGVDRINIKGRCKAGKLPVVSLVSLHQFEEPCISFKNGSGTVFFSGCNLECVYCQNADISQEIKGKEVTVERLKEIFLEQQQRGADNINLVTPSIYIEQIREALILAKKDGLSIPIVYNSSGYDKVQSLKTLAGLIDIYLPDFKYASDELGKKYSKVNNYFTIATEAIKEMRRQVSDVYDENGKMLSGLIIRHMILPSNLDNTKEVINYVRDNFGKDTCISIMSQYYPTNKVDENNYSEINRKLTRKEVKEIERYILKNEMYNGFFQDISSNDKCYTPEFNSKNV